jgi:hypothetical protein
LLRFRTEAARDALRAPESWFLLPFGSLPFTRSTTTRCRCCD